MSKKERVCLNCKHYFISFDPNCPYACKLYGFSSKSTPSIAIKKETGTECLGFDEKQSRKTKEEEKTKVDYNDKKYW